MNAYFLLKNKFVTFSTQGLESSVPTSTFHLNLIVTLQVDVVEFSHHSYLYYFRVLTNANRMLPDKEQFLEV